jgi:V/A-type H+-transporting ATPase subunit D
MEHVRGAPPGRAGRLWLRRRLEMAERGADILDSKLRILRSELQRLVLLEQRTGEAWARAGREARLWADRAVVLGGERAVRLAAGSSPATVTISLTTSMGVRHPSEAVCAVPEPDVDAPPSSNAALPLASDRHRQALDAAVQHAAVSAAVRIVEAELQSTRLRLRAIEHRWIPRLRRALADVAVVLEEEEHADAVRLRWSVEQVAEEDER